MSPTAADSPQPRIAAAVIVHEGKVLLVRRRVAEGKLSWQFPAGAIENGETPGQAAVRETREEARLTVAEPEILGQRIHPDTGRTMVYVACEVLAGDATIGDPVELTEIAWVRRDQLPAYVPHGFYPAVRTYLNTKLT